MSHDEPARPAPQQPRQGLAPCFLIATPTLLDPTFAHTVVLLVESGPGGSYGMVLNRPAPIDLGTLLEGAGIAHTAAKNQLVWLGGPVQPQSGLVLYVDEPHVGPYEPQSAVLPGLSMSSSMVLLQDIAHGAGPRRFALFLGRASWGAGQLETELSAGVWIPTDPDLDLLFQAATERVWQQALHTLGADPASIAAGGAEA